MCKAMIEIYSVYTTGVCLVRGFVLVALVCICVGDHVVGASAWVFVCVRLVKGFVLVVPVLVCICVEGQVGGES